MSHTFEKRQWLAVSFENCAKSPHTSFVFFQNGGTCVDTKDDIMCSCPSGYEGNYCEQNKAACAAGHQALCQSTAVFCAATPEIGGTPSKPM